MGGRLTVSSRVQCGSTFTFILPYKVSDTCDHSDDPDELTDMADRDAASDDTSESFFQFKPRTLGSLFTSNVSCRTQKLLPHNIGYTGSHKLNGFSENSYSFPSSDVHSKETASLENACSASNTAEALSNSKGPLRQSVDPDSAKAACRANDTNGQIQNPIAGPTNHAEASSQMDVAKNTNEHQGKCMRQEKSVSSSQCNSRSSSEVVSNSTLKPKILLVEDNKINVMVTQSMMKQLGHSIDVVNNGVEAVRAVQRCTYNLVLMVISKFTYIFQVHGHDAPFILCRMFACRLWMAFKLRD